ncbi:unnamed protein product [Prunus brigantina]
MSLILPCQRHAQKDMAVNALLITPLVVLSSPPPIQFTTILEFILCVCLATATLFIQVPHEYINEAAILTILFKGLPSIFCAFGFSIILAFSGAFTALMIIRNKPAIARIFGLCSMASMSSAMALLMWAIYNKLAATI